MRVTYTRAREQERRNQKMNEKEIESVLVREAKRAGGRAYKWISPGNNGVPDRIVILPGLQEPVFVELKTASGKLSSLQCIQIDRLRTLGQYVEVVRGIKGLADFFRKRGYPDTAERIRKKYGSDEP